MITLPGMCSETFLLQYCGEDRFFSFFRVFHTQQSYLYGLYGFLHARGSGGQALFCVYPSSSFYAIIWGLFFLYDIYIFLVVGFHPSLFPSPVSLSLPSLLSYSFSIVFLLSIASFRVRISPLFSFIFIK